MADFIKLKEVYTSEQGYADHVDIILNKYKIKEIYEDRAHDQTVIHYDDGREIFVRDTLEEINQLSAE